MVGYVGLVQYLGFSIPAPLLPFLRAQISVYITPLKQARVHIGLALMTFLEMQPLASDQVLHRTFVILSCNQKIIL